MNCEFCKSILSSKSNLVYHQKTNKKCLGIQTKEKETIEVGLNACDFCNKSFSVSNLKTHLKTCKHKKKFEFEQQIKKEIEEQNAIKIEEIKIHYEAKFESQKEVIQKLKDCIIKLKAEKGILIKDHDEIIKIAKEPKNKTTNKNKINVTSPTTFLIETEKVKKLLDDKYDRFMLAEGQKGIAKFAYENIIKDDEGHVKYICTDPSRGIFTYLNDNGESEKDFQAEKITSLLWNSDLREKTRTLGTKIWTREDGSLDSEKFGMYQPQVYEISKMNSDNSTFRNKLACLTTNPINL